MTEKFRDNELVNKNIYIKGSLHVLDQVELITDHYLTIKSTNKDEILLNIYGILQTLFVGVDALYDFVRSVTNNKYLININQNDRLHELKFIRNDVVGHPTSRTYSNNRTGFCILDTNNISIEKIKYSSYVLDNKTNKSELQVTKEVNLFELIKAYNDEVENILEQVELFLENPYSKNIVSLIKNLEQQYLNGEDISIYLNEVIANIISYNTSKSKSQNRLLWRLDLLKEALNWQSSDPEISNLVDYIIQFQLQKILEIALDITSQYQKLRRLKLPYLIKEFYKDIKLNEQKVISHLANLHDSKHPFYQSDLNEMKKVLKSNASQKVLNILNNEKDEQRIYLLGSILKRYNSNRNWGELHD